MRVNVEGGIAIFNSFFNRSSSISSYLYSTLWHKSALALMQTMLKQFYKYCAPDFDFDCCYMTIDQMLTCRLLGNDHPPYQYLYCIRLRERLYDDW